MSIEKLTDKRIADIISDIVVIVDTREQKNDHILKYLNDNHIPYSIEKLNTADYSIRLPSFPDLKLDYQFLVEKKNSLDEIAGNFTRDRDRFVREFERIDTEKIHLVIENATWKKLFNGSYRSNFSPRSFMASLLTWCMRYGCPVWFVGIDESPEVIYNLLKYELLERLKQLKKEQESVDKLQ